MSPRHAGRSNPLRIEGQAWRTQLFLALPRDHVEWNLSQWLNALIANVQDHARRTKREVEILQRRLGGPD